MLEEFWWNISRKKRNFFIVARQKASLLKIRTLAQTVHFALSFSVTFVVSVCLEFDVCWTSYNTQAQQPRRGRWRWRWWWRWRWGWRRWVIEGGRCCSRRFTVTTRMNLHQDWKRCGLFRCSLRFWGKAFHNVGEEFEKALLFVSHTNGNSGSRTEFSAKFFLNECSGLDICLQCYTYIIDFFETCSWSLRTRYKASLKNTSSKLFGNDLQTRTRPFFFSAEFWTKDC